MARGGDPDVVIVGGGFFGCCLALFLRSVARRVVLVEQRDELLAHASRVNQARVHTGFHYPRSFVTALRSRELSTRFAADFPEAIRSDFQMLYAIARRRSRVTTARFRRMFEDMGAPIFNPHRYTLEEGGMKQTDAVQLAFKREADPRGIIFGIELEGGHALDVVGRGLAWQGCLDGLGILRRIALHIGQQQGVAHAQLVEQLAAPGALRGEVDQFGHA